MILTTSGTVLGVRSSERTNPSTGEVRTTRTLDIYDPADGPGELQLRDDVEAPDPGTQVTCKVQIRAYSGFVRDGKAGDARVSFQCIAIEPVEADEVSTARSRRKTG